MRGSIGSAPRRRAQLCVTPLEGRISLSGIGSQNPLIAFASRPPAPALVLPNIYRYPEITAGESVRISPTYGAPGVFTPVTTTGYRAPVASHPGGFGVIF